MHRGILVFNQFIFTFLLCYCHLFLPSFILGMGTALLFCCPIYSNSHSPVRAKNNYSAVISLRLGNKNIVLIELLFWTYNHLVKHKDILLSALQFCHCRTYFSSSFQHIDNNHNVFWQATELSTVVGNQ